ncbi:septum site-determining protein MinC [Ureibacillus manganicus]|uniref:Probable septum site-determining protein MinC n=1 Tax=Ureibacillus manganicus DSM 26584 TaxID=1384049 RepID=A0A0A3IUZ7_9BACL|nr:septum site-determining protein MinC [Ureibacillus manganicus]KGR78657.1 septum site-determining protein MinC [Ureibacillus manganicus DSM 26584]
MKKQLVHIKGTKEGLVLRLDDCCAYADLLEELENRVSEGGLDNRVDVQLDLGFRFLTKEQKNDLVQVVEKSGNMHVSSVFSEVISVNESNEMVLASKRDTYIGIVRSGQIVQATGDIVIVGDVNPNGRVEAGGSIYVLGKLKGQVHAGFEGNKDAIIVASHFEPTHVFIADQIDIMSNEKTFISQHVDQIIAYIDQNGVIAYERLQEAKNLRPSLNTIQGGS